MLPLLQAINAKCLTTGAIIAAFPGSSDTSTGTTRNYPVAYFHGAAPEGVPLPYLVSTVIAAPTVLKYGGIQRVECQIQFAAYGVGDDTTYAKLKTFTDAMDETILTLATGHMVNTTRLGDPIPTFQDPVDGKDSGGGDVWQWVVSYEFITSPT